MSIESLPPAPTTEESDLLNYSIRKYKRRNNGEIIPSTAAKTIDEQRSFREILVETKEVPHLYFGEEDDVDNMMYDGNGEIREDFLINVAVSLEDGVAAMPCMEISQEDYQILWKLWKKTLIIKVLGRNISYSLLEQKIWDLWKLEWDFKLVDSESGYYLARFRLAKDYEHVLNGGAWMVL